MSQPRLNRSLILDLLDKLRNPGKGTPVVEIEDEEPEVRAPQLTKALEPPSLCLGWAPGLECFPEASLRRKRGRRDGELGTGLGAQRAMGEPEAPGWARRMVGVSGGGPRS